MRKTGFILAVLLLIIATGEFTARLLCRGVLRRSRTGAPLAEARREDRAAAREGPGERWWGEHFVEVVHPYVGFVADPHRPQGLAISDQGFICETNPVVKRLPGRIVIALFGGSFARQLYTHSRDALARAAGADARPVVVVNAAMGGYKQPQQLMALAWLIALGAEFDAVVNLDGFNEVALPIPDNLHRGVFPLFPRDWSSRVADVTDPEAVPLLARLQVLNERRRRWAAGFARFPLTRSAMAGLAWQALDRRFAKQRALLLAALRDVTPAGTLPYVASGPSFGFPSEDALFAYLADAWVRCSKAMAGLSESVGATYFHFLQPNQYVPASKPLTPEEQRVAVNPKQAYRPGVEKGYPHLRRREADLLAAGIRFHDLTMVFSNEVRTLYVDDCCHLSREGYDMIAGLIGQIIARELAGR
jgi:hypothetical protein